MVALHRFVTFVPTLALFPFAIVLGSELFTVAREPLGTLLAGGLALSATLIALFFWYGLEWIAIRRAAEENGWTWTCTSHNNNPNSSIELSKY